MARSGHVEVLKHGTGLAAQVGYRLSGATPEKSASRLAQERQVDYRLGAGAMDSRRVWFLGSGATAEHLAYRPGEVLRASDGQIVRDAMFGIDRATGERIAVKTRHNPHAQIAAHPYYAEITDACATAGVDLADLYRGMGSAARWRSLAKTAARLPGGTVVFRTAEALLRGNEAAWELHDRGPSTRGVSHPRPVVRFDRARILTRLGAHYRRLAAAGTENLPGDPLDLSLPDGELGAVVHGAVATDYERLVPYGNAGYEQTLTCPKSFSVAAFTADEDTREQWLDLVHDATVAATDGLMARVGNARTGHEGDGQSAELIDGDGYAATVSIESYSRSLDPHLHGHVMFPNRIVCTDGAERGVANGGRDLINHAPWFQAEYERHLRGLSVDRGLVPGWEFDTVNQQYEVAGSDPIVRALFSRGGADVDGELAALLEDETDAVTTRRREGLRARAKRTVTASKEDQTRTWADIRTRMHDRADEDDFDLATAFTAPRHPAYSQPENWDDATWAVAIDEYVCEHQSFALDVQIEAAVRAFAPHTWSDGDVLRAAEAAKAIAFLPGAATDQPSRRGRIGAAEYASIRVLEAEKRVVATFTAGFDANTHRLHPVDADRLLAEWLEHSGSLGAGRTLTPGQLDLYRQMTTGRDLIGTVVGSAGSGKTTALDAVSYALGRRGMTIYGVSTAAIATQGLKDAAHIDGSTVARFLARIDYATDDQHPARLRIDQLERSGRRRDHQRAQAIRATFDLPRIDHLIVDEASMLAAPEKARILEWAIAQDVSVTLVGDRKQLQAIGPSSLFGWMHETRGGAELTENLRQKTDLGRECAALLRDGYAYDALQILAAAGHFQVARSEVDKNRLLIESWLTKAAAFDNSGDRMRLTGLEASRNDQVDVLNHLARHWARHQGWLTGQDVAYKHAGNERTYAVGDHIQITRNIRRHGQQRDLNNGTRALVTAVKSDGVHLTYWDADGQHEDRLTVEQAVTHSRHGYATTTHKLQGQTVKSLSIDLGGDRDLSSAYVAFTRSEDESFAVVNVCDIADGAQLETLLKLDPDARRDAVLSIMAIRMQDAGFNEDRTAHSVVGERLSGERPTARSPMPTGGRHRDRAELGSTTLG
ncbi:MAG: AAA family ATPase [Actinomycetota bacterium]|nr:AAA family ATPase [Actinomycetota bacterium]